MVKSFEHLSDAQIEQYGTDSFSETSNAPVIEAHLEDCADCRARLLEHQRARFVLLANASMNARPDPSDSTSSNHNLAPVPAGDCPSSDGPAEDDLRKLAAGLLAPAEALGITRHVAQCPHCARVLRTFTEDFSDDLTPEELAAEKELMAQLKSSSPTWQKDIASQAMKANRDNPFEQLKKKLGLREAASARATEDASALKPAITGGWFPRWILAPAALAACAAIAFAVWFTQRDTPEKVEKLLAQAYTEQRTMEYRWPGAEWGPVRVTRGSGQSSLSRPTAQLEAEKILAEHEGSTLKDPSWLTAKAEAELLDNQPQLAITDLTQALSANPGSSDVELMLAIAYAQQGDKLDDRASRERALEILNRIISLNTPPDPAVLFNRALLYQRLNLPDKAKSDLDELLKWEHQPSWKPEDQKRGGGSN